jgi:hypothetical protein
MSEMNPFSPKDNDQGTTESNVFLDLNKPDEATGVPSVLPGMSESGPSGGSSFSPGAASGESKFNGQVILAGLVFTIGVGSIYAMRYIGMQAGIKESVTMVEYTASTTTPDFVDRFESIMSDLEEVSISVQFDESTVLPKAPFILETEMLADETYEPAVSDNLDPSEQLARMARQRAEMERMEREQKLAEYESIAQGLTLQSLIGGSRPVARISGEPVAVGMMVADTFKVVSIKGSVVILQVEDIRYELGLGSSAVRID